VELTAERFKQIVVDARTQIIKERGDRRMSVRIGVRYRATVRLVEADAVPVTTDQETTAPPMPARIRDISSSGVGLTTPVALGGRFRLEMPSERGMVYGVACSVESCRAVDANQFFIGARFDDDAQAA
jgi:hypothetical protein